jgi:hypothetical protein
MTDRSSNLDRARDRLLLYIAATLVTTSRSSDTALVDAYTAFVAALPLELKPEPAATPGNGSIYILTHSEWSTARGHHGLARFQKLQKIGESLALTHLDRTVTVEGSGVTYPMDDTRHYYRITIEEIDL